MASRIQLRRGTAAQWADANPILAGGEPGRESDTGRLKIGDGATAWAGLPAFVDEVAQRAAFAPVYYDDAGTFADRGSVQTISRQVPSPNGLQPTVWINVSGRGDNATFRGVAAGVFRAGDLPGTTTATKGVLYGLQSIVAPIADRNNVPFDDVVGLSIENQGSGKGTDGIYLGRNRSDKGSNPTGRDWANALQIDAWADTGIRLIGTYDIGLSLSGGTYTTAAIRIGNNQAISAQSATNVLQEIVKLTASNNLSLYAAKVTILSNGGFLLADCTAVPSAPTGGVVLYSEAGVLKAKRPGGVITTITP